MHKLKGEFSSYLPAFRKIAEQEKLSLTRLNDMKKIIRIYISYVKPNAAPVQRGIKNVPVEQVVFLLNVIQDQNGLDCMVERERKICLSILKKSINEN